MNLLLIYETAGNLRIPEFGEAFAAHIRRKTHPDIQAASRTAWSLLAHGMKLLGHDPLPRAAFMPGGKPYFENCSLHFSLAHSGSLAAALISPGPCAVDIECIRPETEARLAARCLSEAEQAAGCGFFETWTKKECIGKLTGQGLPARPYEMDILRSPYAGCFFTEAIFDSGGQEYMLCTLCTEGYSPKIQKITPEELF